MHAQRHRHTHGDTHTHTHTHAHTETDTHSYVDTQSHLHSPHTYTYAQYIPASQDQRLLYHWWYMPSMLPLDYSAHCLWPSVSTVEWSPTDCSTYTCSSRICLNQQESTLGKDTQIHTHAQMGVQLRAHTCTHAYTHNIYLHLTIRGCYIINSIRALLIYIESTHWCTNNSSRIPRGEITAN